MAQDLTVNIKTTSDVPQAMDKAKQATTGFGKQVEDIQKKFSTSFKDIFLSFLGPMALVGGAIALIGKLIAENQKKQEEANQSAIDGTNKLMSAEDKYWANKRNNEKTSKETVEQAETQRTTTTKEFLESDPRGQEIVKREKQKVGNVQQSFMGINDFFKIYTDKKIQDEVQKIIAEDLKKNPGAGINPDAKSDTFKSPEGFGNVIGVGPNPVMEAMARQIEIQEQQLAELQKISGSTPAGQGDFTKGTQSK
jgi:hypothetical protein